MAKMQIADGVISSSGDYSLFHGTTKVADVNQNEIRVQGDLIAENYIVSSSTTYVTTSFSSGNTAFGNSSDNTHAFTGDVTIDGGGLTIEDTGEYLRFTDGNASIRRSSNDMQFNAYSGFIFSNNPGESFRIDNSGNLQMASGKNITSVQNITATGNISGSATSTGSFGQVVAQNKFIINNNVASTQKFLFHDENVGIQRAQGADRTANGNSL